ncbi:MAG: FtsX-like permease family protein, partial [Lewinella sp.]|nr:FtsX-like permease family protein [Lewinella sp.]
LNTYQRRDLRAEGAAVAHGLDWYQIDEDQLETLEIELLEGRNFRGRTSPDTNGLILNESAVALLGLDQPIGKTLIKNEGENDEERLQIIGVVKDFHLESLQHEVKPLAMQYFHGFVFKDYISVRLKAGDPMAAIAYIEKSWKAFEPGVPLRYGFLDARYDQLFKREVQLARLFAVFTGLSLFIACLGLFGLVTFVVLKRTKEIGIRKVLGASVAGIMTMLVRQFLGLAIIAGLLATPLAFWFAKRWLMDFAYRIDLGIWPFALGIGIAMIITLLTVSFQSLRAATVNPIKSLRSE